MTTMREFKINEQQLGATLNYISKCSSPLPNEVTINIINTLNHLPLYSEVIAPSPEMASEEEEMGLGKEGA